MGNRLVGYTGDVAAIIVPRNIETAQFRLDMAKRRMTRWMRGPEIEIASEIKGVKMKFVGYAKL